MRSSRVGPLGVVSVLILAFIPRPVESQSLRLLVERGRHPAIRWGRFSDVQDAAIALYGRNRWQPLWLAGNRPTPQARGLLDQLATAGDRGLDPDDYDAGQLAAFAATLDRGGADLEQAVRFDAGLTVAALRLAQAVARGRVGHLVGEIAAERFDPIPVVTAIHAGSDPDSILTSVEPPGASFRELKRVLGRHRRFAKDSVARRPYFMVRIRQIELALERWRWLPRAEPSRMLTFFAPASRLQLVDPAGTSLWLRAGPPGSSCRIGQVLSGRFWMLTLRPADLPGAAVRLRLEDGTVVAAGGRGSEAACLTIGDGELLAELLLRGRADWTAERVREAIAGTRQQFVRLAQPVQVRYIYTTVVSENGQAAFYPDQLGHDRRLDVLLRKGYPYQ